MAFSLPIIEKFRAGKLFDKESRSGVKFLVMAPTRELAQQISMEMISLKNFPTEYRVTTLYGGSPKIDQRKQLRYHNPDIIVATPGRLTDLYNMGDIDFRGIKTVCLDEADYMLEIGFKEDV